jgi:hypothetical protein
MGFRKGNWMGAGAGVFRLIAGLAVVLALGVGAPLAVAAEIDQSNIIAPQHDPPQAVDGWQAGTCKLDAPTPCSVDTEPQWF